MNWRPRSECPKYEDLPWNGATQVWTWVRYEGEIVPVVASDDQYCLLFADGSKQWVEKWDTDPIYWDREPGEVERMKAEAARRERNGFRTNKPTGRYGETPKRSKP